MDGHLSVASRLPAPRDWRRVELLAAGAGLLACVVLSAALALEAEGQPALVALARVSTVGVPGAVGLYAWWARLHERFGLLLMALGGAVFVTTLAESADPTRYAIGRAGGWGVEVLLVVLFLSFPSGRLTARADRLLAGAMGVAVLTLYVPRLLIAERFELPSPYTSCVRDCPANPFFALRHEPAFLDAVIGPLGVVAVFVVMVLVVVRLRARLGAATAPTRRLLGPVIAVATARATLLALGVFARWIDPQIAALRGVAWLLAIALPAVALAFLVGLLRWRLFAGRALERLAACLHGKPDATTLRRAFAEAFDDPSVQVVFPVAASRERWMDPHGQPLELPERGSGLSVSPVSAGGRPVAAIVHDEALGEHPRLLHAGLAMAEVALENQRLAAEAASAMREVRASRSRIAASAERERRRIERDLHDGAQQRLVALRIELELAEELVRRDPEQGARRLHALESEVDEALEELRALAHGVYPSLLADRGLPEALRAVLDRFPISGRLDERAIGRYAPEVESAVYFCVLEALQNALKHARGVRRVAVRLVGEASGELRFSVDDDGAGLPRAALRTGAGLRGMRDRIAAVGGTVELTARPGGGTLVDGWVPGAGAQALDADDEGSERQEGVR
jgi:signal transduction histidine kinase